MTWTDRQRAMLAEMGLAVWTPSTPADVPAADGDPGGDAVTATTAAASATAVTAPGATTRPATAATRAAPVGSGPTSAAMPTPSTVDIATAMPPASDPAELLARPIPPPSPVLSPPSRRPGPAPRAPIAAATEAPVTVSGHRPTGVESMDWSTLRETVAGCAACSLCTGRTQTVFGTGSIEAQWLVVGEAPGEQEDRQGEPFVGKSGQLLDNMLRAIQRTRQDSHPDGSPATSAHQVYIANTVKCRPPGNRNPDPEELVRCEPYLIRQIALLRPRIILAMGRFAVQSLLRSTEPVGRLRGRVHHYQGVPLIVTYHPAYLLRNPQDKAKAWDDLCLARRIAEEGAASV